MSASVRLSRNRSDGTEGAGERMERSRRRWSPDPLCGRGQRERHEDEGSDRESKNQRATGVAKNDVRREDAWNGLSASTLTGTPMDLYEVEPERAARGAVIVVQEAFGITDHIKDVCRRFAGAGYRAVAPHVFHRSGDPVLGYDEMDKVIPHIMELKADDLLADLDATIAYLGKAGFEPARIGIVGFCMGGSVVFLAAARRVARRGRRPSTAGGLPRSLRHADTCSNWRAELKTPWLGLFGDSDQSIPVDDVEALRAAVAAAPVADRRSSAMRTPTMGSTAMPGAPTTRPRRRTDGDATSGVARLASGGE